MISYQYLGHTNHFWAAGVVLEMVNSERTFKHKDPKDILLSVVIIQKWVNKLPDFL